MNKIIYPFIVVFFVSFHADAQKKDLIYDTLSYIKSPYISSPLKRIVITSDYGYRRHPVTGRYTMHHGIDLRAHYEPVYSILPGKVEKVGYDPISGHYLTIRTASITITYCHLAKSLVKQGQLLRNGTPIAVSGNTGRSTGPHLHIGIKIKSQWVNPHWLLNRKL